MAKLKSMGTEYQITAEGIWTQIAEAVKTTKKLVGDTQPKISSSLLLSSRFHEVALENKALGLFLVPKDGESFVDYRTRFIQAFYGSGLRGKLAKLFAGKKVLYNFQLTKNDGESILRIATKTSEDIYQTRISSSGYYSSRGASIAKGIKANLEQNKMQFKYNTLERLV